MEFAELVQYYTNQYAESQSAEEKTALAIVICTLWERNHVGYARLEMARKMHRDTNIPAAVRIYSDFLDRTEEHATRG